MNTNINIDFNLEEENVNKNVTSLNDLEENVNNKNLSFIDESKQLKKCNIIMIDFTSNKNINELKYKCYWCKNSFDSEPIGCPIKYNSKKAIKKYFSKITKEVYTIKEEITIKKSLNLPLNQDTNININDYCYYDSDGIFCSFNCCKSWILDNKHLRIYDFSLMLLNKIFNSVMNTKNMDIVEAPHWRLLKDFGGDLDINDFRNNFHKLQYKFHGTSKQIFNPIRYIYEKNIKF